jgi:hypothetical protein
VTKTEKQFLQDLIENEGFSYCFTDYSNFPAIKDKEFHRLREQYIRAHEELEYYITNWKGRPVENAR